MIADALRKDKILRKARDYFHETIYVPTEKKYVTGIRHRPMRIQRGEEGIEPVIDIDGLYRIDDQDAWLTVNSYNAVILNTKNMLIVDIDFGDDRISDFARAKDIDEVIANLHDLSTINTIFWHNYVDLDGPFVAGELSKQSYRVYRTHSGCRVICTSIAFPYDTNPFHAKRLMRFLRGDPKYIELCETQRCYQARLTPKPWRDHGSPCHVCNLEHQFGENVIHPAIEEQLLLHDELTLREVNDSSLA